MRRLPLLLLFLLAAPALAQFDHPGTRTTFANLKPCNASRHGVVVAVNNATDRFSCDGGGTATSFCQCDAPTSTWVFPGVPRTEGEFEGLFSGGPLNFLTTADPLTSAPVYLANGFVLPSGSTCTGGDVQPTASGPTEGAVNCTDAATSTWELAWFDENYTGGDCTAFLAAYFLGTPSSKLTEVDVELQCVTPGADAPAAWTDANTQDAQVSFDTADRLEHSGTANITPNGSCASGDAVRAKFEVDSGATTEDMTQVHFVMAGLKCPVGWGS